MPRLVVAAAGLVFALFSSPMSPLTTSASAASPTMERIQKAGVIKLGYRADARPYSFRDEKGRAAGFIVNLCQEVAAEITASFKSAIRTEYVLVPSTARFEAVRDGQIDILCDPSSVTLERRELVDFSIPTFLDGAATLSRTSRPVQRFEDLKGWRVGVLSGTTTEQSIRGALSDLGIIAEMVTVKDHNAGFQLLTSDKIHAYFADRAILASMIYGGMPGFQLSRQYFSYETYALAVPRDDSAFRLLVDRTLARLYRTGRIEAIMAKAFGRGIQDDMMRALILIHSVPDR